MESVIFIVDKQQKVIMNTQTIKDWKSKKWEKKSSKYSSFWVPKHSNDSSLDELINLGALQKTVTNFVKIQTELNIPCELAIGGSYTDMKKVTISADYKNLDLTVGLALHEASHIKWTHKDMMEYFKVLINMSDSFYKHTAADTDPRVKNASNTIVSEELTFDKVFSKLFNDSMNMDQRNDMVMLYKNLWNWIEDRRIDKLTYSKAPGYRGYYVTLYNKYFKSEEISKGLKSAYKDETLASYMFRIINFMNPASDFDALNGLRAIYEIIDYRTIDRLEDSFDAVEVALEVVVEILKNIDIDAKQSSKKENGKGKPSRGENGDGEASDEEMTSEELDDLESQIDKMKEFLNGDATKKTASRDIAKKINAVANSKMSQEKVNFKGDKYNTKRKTFTTDVIVIENYNENFKNVLGNAADITALRSTGLKEAIDEGITKGKLLGKKLKIRNDNKIKLSVRKKHGSLDRRLTAELGYGNSRVFNKKTMIVYDDVFIHITIDASGSMSNDMFNNSISMAVSVAQAATMIDGMHVVISTRSTARLSGNNRYAQTPYILVAYDSKLDKMSKIKKLFPYLHAHGTTPEGLTFEAISKHIISKAKGKDSYFINLSDGMPESYTTADEDYSGEAALDHTKGAITKLRKQGLKIISFFLTDLSLDYLMYNQSSTKQNFIRMYGNNSEFVNVTSITAIANALNKKFLQK